MTVDEILLILMVVSVIAGLMSGFPVAFVLSGVALIFAMIGGFVFGNEDSFDILSSIPQRVYNIETGQTLLAVPLFIFMGVMLERSRVAEELLDNMGKAFGPLRGGLAISVCIVGALLAASTGIVGATVVTMGLLSLPTMLNRGYSKQLACGTIAASGTLGQIIPPSIVLVLLGDQLSSAYQDALRVIVDRTGDFSLSGGSVSVNELFAGAFLPGLVLVGMYILWIVIVSITRPSAAPAIQDEDAQDMNRWGSPKLVLSLAFLVAAGAAVLLLLDGLGVATVLPSGLVVLIGFLLLAFLFSWRIRPKIGPAMIVGLLSFAAFLIAAFALHWEYEGLTRVVYLLLVFVAFAGPMTNAWNDAFWGPILRSLVPPMVLIIAVLGSILGGFAAPTEAAAVGAVGAIMLAGYRLNPKRGQPILIGFAALVLVLFIANGFDIRMTIQEIETVNVVAFVVSVVLTAILLFSIAYATVRTITYRVDNSTQVSHDPELQRRSWVAWVFLLLLGGSILLLALNQLDLLAILALIVLAFTVYAVVTSYKSGRAHTNTVMSDVVRQTMMVTSMVFVILIGAQVFAAAFRGFHGDVIIEEFLHSLPGGTVGAVLVVMLAMFLLGFVLDFLEITFIVVPVVAPILLTMEFRGDYMSPVWLGVMMAMNLQTSYLTPPFGFSLFYLRGVAPKSVTTMDIYRGIIPFVAIQLLALVVLWFWPELATWLPDVVLR